MEDNNRHGCTRGWEGAIKVRSPVAPHNASLRQRANPRVARLAVSRQIRDIMD
jgi:hypothetical protein